MKVDNKVLEVMCEFIAEGYDCYSSRGEYYCTGVNERLREKEIPITKCKGYFGECGKCPLYSTSNMMEWLKGLSRKDEKMNFKVFESSEGNVWKYVFTKDDMVAETVLYKYNSFYERTVICCSTMSGCPVGCKFCGTGNRFVRNLTASEIVEQIATVLSDKNITDVSENGKRFQIMFMSMGEPLLNWNEVEKAIISLHESYPNAELLLSTIAPMESESIVRMIQLSKMIDKVGLQFSIHKSNDTDRNKLIPYKNKLTLEMIRDLGIRWWQETGRHPYLNYCIDGTNNTDADKERLQLLFSPFVFNFTFSVVCSPNENMKDAGFKNLDAIRDFEQSFLEKGYNTRIFDPAGQDDIGGGCGQLWYVQDWMKTHSLEK